MSEREPRHRNYCFTWNNYDKKSVEYLNLLVEQGKCDYVIVGQEIGSENGTPHLQGYMEFPSAISIKTLKKNARFNSVHFEQRKGTQRDAINYCKKGLQSHEEWKKLRETGPNYGKEAKFVELGEKKQQGERTDLSELKQIALTNGIGEVTKTADFPSIRAVEKFMTYNSIKRNWKPEIWWIYGTSGSGKSYLSSLLAEKTAKETGERIFEKRDANKWFEGYDQEKIIVLDDYRGNWMPLCNLLGLLDRYSTRVEFKGGSSQFLGKWVFITSIKPPEECYNFSAMNDEEPAEQLTRRIDHILKIDGPKVTVDLSMPNVIYLNTFATEVGVILDPTSACGTNKLTIIKKNGVVLPTKTEPLILDPDYNEW